MLLWFINLRKKKSLREVWGQPETLIDALLIFNIIQKDVHGFG